MVRRVSVRRLGGEHVCNGLEHSLEVGRDLCGSRPRVEVCRHGRREDSDRCEPNLRLSTPWVIICSIWEHCGVQAGMEWLVEGVVNGIGTVLPVYVLRLLCFENPRVSESFEGEPAIYVRSKNEIP